MSKSKKEEPVIRFSKEDHSYYKGEVKGYSATTVIGYFRPPFEGEYWKKYKALEKSIPNFKILKKKRWPKFPQIAKPPESWLDEMINIIPPEYYDNAYKEVCDSWEASSTEGTKFHDSKEEQAYTRGFSINPWDHKKYKVNKIDKIYDNQSIVNNLADLQDGNIPELLVSLSISAFLF